MHAMCDYVFFFNDTATTEIYTLSLHDALPISERPRRVRDLGDAADVDDANERVRRRLDPDEARHAAPHGRSEEHTSELQSRQYLVCRLLLEKKKKLTRSATLMCTYSMNLQFTV